MRGRHLLAALLVSAAVAGPPLGSQEVAQPAPQTFAEALLSGPLLLSRTVRQQMSDGQTIAVTRTYRIRATPLADGWLLEGDSIDVSIDAPDHVAGLAEIERTRQDHTFPMRLTAEGGLQQDLEAEPDDGTALAAARRLIAQRIAAAPIGSEDAREAAAAMDALGEKVAQHRTGWPLDLFRPIAASRMETRDVPDGSVTVSLMAETAEGTGLMSRYDRVVTTRIGPGERVVRETWRLWPETAAN